MAGSRQDCRDSDVDANICAGVSSCASVQRLRMPAWIFFFSDDWPVVSARGQECHLGRYPCASSAHPQLRKLSFSILGISWHASNAETHVKELEKLRLHEKRPFNWLILLHCCRISSLLTTSTTNLCEAFDERPNNTHGIQVKSQSRN